jgi:acetyl-CoA carboxylase carboxyltransferase component
LVYAHDGSFLGGSSSRIHALKIGKVLDLALRIGVPVVALNYSSGSRFHEGVELFPDISVFIHNAPSEQPCS